MNIQNQKKNQKNKQRLYFAVILFMNVCIVVGSLSANYLAGRDLWRSVVCTVMIVSMFCFFMSLFALPMLSDESF